MADESLFGFDFNLGDVLGNLGTAALDLFKDSKGNIDWGKVLTTGAGVASVLNTANGGGLGGLLSGLTGSSTPQVGYQGGIPKYTAVRETVPGAFEPTVPGAPNRRYLSDIQYVPKNESVAAAQSAAAQQAAGLAALQAQRNEQTNMASGGLAAMKKGKYLNGDTDGMADEISTSINGTQPAALSDGEFVIPADVVSHLGNGNSQAGAKRLYEMMDKVRKARTGTKKQGKQINPNKFMPA